ncbi:MAG TPA: ABC transporter substrate-binding protein [Trebonia sp.]|jgi:ABC-type nitrate/sulfonate/bicarbonate transport system substrate-binding protein|nr:ABC transporter substrate-binding protein [Trebonia sp.]
MKTISSAKLRRLPARRTRRLAALLGCGALAAVLAACGSAGASAAGGGTAAGTSSSVTIGKAVDTIGFTTVDVAKAEGYFAKAGVNVNEDLLSGSSTAFAALQSGSVNFVCASSTALISAKTKGLPLEAVASLDYGVSLQLLVSDSWIKAHHMSPNQPLDTVMHEMTGAKLGVISTTDLTYDHYLEQQAGVSSSEFTYINMNSQSAAISAVKYGEIDAFLLSPPSTYYAQSQGDAEVIASLHEVPELANMAYDILVVDTAWAKTHRSEVTSVATAMAKADNIMGENPQAVLGSEKTHYPTMTTSVLLNSLHNVTFTKNGEFTPTMWQESLKEYNQTSTDGPAKVNISASSGVWTNQYIQQSQLSG